MTIKLLSYAEYCKNITAHRTAAYVYGEDGKRQYLYKGKSYTPEQFIHKFPIHGKIVADKDRYKGENPDKTKIA